VKGKGGPDGAWLFDMKEQGEPSALALAKSDKARRAMTGKGLKPAVRVVTALEAALERPPRLVGTTKLGTLSMFVRRLSPQEDKLDLRHLREEDLEPLARYLGALTGRAHRRGATRPARKNWKKKDLKLLVENAIRIAGIHEAAYLAMAHVVHWGE
jgi:hypothetical protein